MEFKITIDGKRHKFCGYSNEAAMEEAKNNIDALITAKREEKTAEKPVREWRDKLATSNPNHYDRLAELGLVEARIKSGTLADLIDVFELSNADKKPRTIKNRQACCNMMCRFFGAEKLVNSIKPKEADMLWEYMTENYAPATYKRQIKTVKQIFSVAVREKWISENPFKHLKGGDSVNTDRQFYITREMADMVMAACPDACSLLIFVLGRYGGLRIPSELIYLKWSDILWEQGKIRISIPKKTGKKESLKHRYLPIFPELVAPLQDYYESLSEGSRRPDDLLFPGIEGEQNLRRGLERIIERAGLTMWPKLFINLRSTRETELLLEKHPLHVVCSWIGNTPAVALKHYAQTTDDVFVQASYLSKPAPTKPTPASTEGPKKGTPRGQNRGQQSFPFISKLLQLISQDPNFTDFLQEIKNPCSDLHGHSIPPRGVEPLSPD